MQPNPPMLELTDTLYKSKILILNTFLPGKAMAKRDGAHVSKGASVLIKQAGVTPHMSRVTKSLGFPPFVSDVLYSLDFLLHVTAITPYIKYVTGDLVSA